MCSFRIGDWEVSLSKDSKPRELMIELTTECNLNCVHCFRNSMRESFGRMTRDIMERILSEIEITGVKAVSLSGWGEPLCHPDFLWFIKELKTRGVKVLLNTNGTLLSKFAEDLVKLGVDEIVVSVDAVEPEIYKKIRRGGILSECIGGIKALYDAKRKYVSTKPLVGVQFTINTMNFDQIYKLALFANHLGVGLIYISNIIPVSREHEKLACYSSQRCVEEVLKQIDKLAKELLSFWNIYVVKSYLAPTQSFHCPFIENDALFIRWDGKVAPCMHYSHDWKFVLNGIERNIKKVIFGDIKTQSLIDIWRNPDYIQFRFKAKFGYKPSCFDCELQEWCSYTFSNESDCYGNSPTCAHCPYARGLVSCPLLSGLGLFW